MMGCAYFIMTCWKYMSDVFADGADKGIIPLVCSELFVRVEGKAAADPNLTVTVEVSYIEVSELVLGS